MLMTELPSSLTTGGNNNNAVAGGTTLLHRSGHYYHLHQPHLAISTPQNTIQRQSSHNVLPSQQYINSATNLTNYVNTGIHRHFIDNRINDVIDQTRNISILYPEILAHIFSYLSVSDKGHASQVCTAWRDAAYHRSVWRGIEAKLHLRKPSPYLFNSIVKRGIKRIQILSLKRGLGDVIKGIPNLESLSLTGCYNIADNSLTNAITNDYLSLIELDLSLCKQITDATLTKIAQHMRNLEYLHLGGCCHISNHGLLFISWGLRKLKKLELRSCWNISDDGIGNLAGLNQSAPGGTSELEHLSLQDCQKITDEALANISNGLNKLVSINLSFCISVSDSGLKNLAKMSSLRELNLRSCDNISDIGMAYLAEGGSRITTLDVSFCDKIGDQALHYISQGLFNLRSLSLSSCQISDEGIFKIAKTLHDLETLNIGQCSRLTDKALLAIAESMEQLKCIDLYGCTKMTENGIKENTLKFPQLTYINLGLSSS